jgi:hypothetical protein
MKRLNQRGSVSAWAVLLAVGGFTPLLGLIVDGGTVVNARLEAARDAGQAARAGADALSAASIRNGGNNVSPDLAITQARAYLAKVGQNGTVTVAGDTVTVTVAGTIHPTLLGVIGVNEFPISETQSARGITEAN